MSEPGGHLRARSAHASRMAQPRGRGAAAQALAEQFNRAAEEGMGQSVRGIGASLSRSELQQAVATAVEQALARARPAPGAGDSEAAARASVELTEALTELRGLINQVASPTQGRSAVVKKTKRYELGQSTCREKARPCSAAGRRAARATAPRGTTQARDRHRFAARARGALPAGDAGRVHVAVEERPALQAYRRGSSSHLDDSHFQRRFASGRRSQQGEHPCLCACFEFHECLPARAKRRKPGG